MAIVGSAFFIAIAGFFGLLFVGGLFVLLSTPTFLAVEALLGVFVMALLFIADLLLSLGLLLPRRFRFRLSETGVEMIQLKGPRIVRDPERTVRTLLFRIATPSLQRPLFWPWTFMPVRVERAWGGVNPDPARLRIYLGLPNSRGIFLTVPRVTANEIAAHASAGGASVTNISEP